MRNRRPDRSVIAIGPGDGLTRRPKTAETVAHALARDIVREGRVAGDNLPTEAAMLERYHVSRESLREALRLLEVQGLVAIRRGPGGGPTVCTVDPANLGRVSSLYFHLAGATYEELWEAWVLAESTLAERAARHPDAHARRAAMGPYLEPPPDGADDEGAELVTAHLAFHTEVASLADNRVLEIVLQTVGQIVAGHSVVTAEVARRLVHRVTDDHRRIAVAIDAGDGPTARTLMVAHIEAMALVANDQPGTRADEFIEWH
jgi:GntR family transcriptional regulator, transcriptional repressor for pyruvate dehydrogenase complex